ncbi:MAG: MBL fold metallo-hydrolase [Candidatus Azobacteroides sp.]|nr:MBL fold metallo-hydrolase [Candidatus Azobacteroides sp.]
MRRQLILIAMFIMATTCGKAQTNENVFLMKLGDSKVYLLSEGQRNGSTDILIGAGPEIIEQYAPDHSFPMAVNVFLWQVDGKNILFDTGYGSALFDNLQFLQVKPEDIDAIFITHMHGDHIGGLLRDDQAAFPKATLYLAQAEYDYWTNEEAINQMPENQRGGFIGAQKVIDAYRDKLYLFEPNAIDSLDNSKELCSGVKAIAAYGHTPGHTTYLIESGNDQLLIWGDLAHAMAVQMPHPEIAVTYDNDPKMAVQSRLTVLQFIVDQEIPIAGMHIPYPGIGTIEKSESGYQFIPAP